MDDNKNERLISIHGLGTVIQANTSVEYENTESANLAFLKAKDRLLDVNHWQDFTTVLLANFQLTDQFGKRLTGPVQKGNLFKIDIPGPGTVDGQGFDWVYVEQITEYENADLEIILVVVRPCPNPNSQSGATAHFYGSEATSSFSLIRQNKTITAMIYDKNVKVNNQAGTSLDHIRDVMVGTAGILLFSKIQWKMLTKGLLGKLI